MGFSALEFRNGVVGTWLKTVTDYLSFNIRNPVCARSGS